MAGPSDPAGSPWCTRRAGGRAGGRAPPRVEREREGWWDRGRTLLFIIKSAISMRKSTLNRLIYCPGAPVVGRMISPFVSRVNAVYKTEPLLRSFLFCPCSSVITGMVHWWQQATPFCFALRFANYRRAITKTRGRNHIQRDRRRPRSRHAAGASALTPKGKLRGRPQHMQSRVGRRRPLL